MKPSTACLLVALMTASAPAFGQDADTKARATLLNREAADHAKRGEWEVAAAMLNEAYRLTHDPALLINLAATELKANTPVDALRHLPAYLAEQTAKAKVKEAVNTQLMPRAMAATGHLTIHFPLDAKVTVDAEPVAVDPGATSVVDDVMPGEHAILVTSGGSEFRQSVTLQAGASADIQATPAPVTATAPPSGVTPALHPVEPPPPQDKPSSDGGFATARNLVPLGLLVGGVAAAGVGVVFTLNANNAANQVNASCTGDCYSNAKSTYSNDTNLATGLYIGGGVLAAGAVVTWLVWPHSTEARVGSLTMRPYAGPGTAGVSGAF